jgi:hypothetical protein
MILDIQSTMNLDYESWSDETIISVCRISGMIIFPLLVWCMFNVNRIIGWFMAIGGALTIMLLYGFLLFPFAAAGLFLGNIGGLYVTAMTNRSLNDIISFYM